MESCLKKLEQGELLSMAEIETLLSVPCDSENYYRLLYLSQTYARATFKKGLVFAQIGLNYEPCSGCCHFCSLSADTFGDQDRKRERTEEVVRMARDLVGKGIADLFLMTTADYPVDRFIEVVEAVKAVAPATLRIVANIGDVSEDEVIRLKASGVTGFYHIRRLREGTDTAISPRQREETIGHILRNGLELYYCIEPVSARHTVAEIAAEIQYARELALDVMAVMRQVTVPDTILKNEEELPRKELLKIAAVTNLVVRPGRGMNMHECSEMSMLAGINQLYAEYGANPRDIKSETQYGRGYNVEQVQRMLRDAGYTL